MSDCDGSGRDDARESGLDRREFLGLLGIGALTLATGTAATAQVATPGCAAITCPDAPLPLPASPNLTGFPSLALIVAALARLDATAKTNRVNFNSCADKFFTAYQLDEPAIAAFLAFDRLMLMAAIRARIGAPTTDPMWVEQGKLETQTAAFWKGWTDPDGCYVDPLGPCPADEQQYGKPKLMIYEATANPQGDPKDSKYELVVNGQGFLRADKMELRIVPRSSSEQPIPVTGTALNLDKDSTFRCGRMKPVVTLTKGNEYTVELKVYGVPAVPYGPFKVP